MARSKTELKTFNRGLVSRLGLARTDLDRTGMSAEVMTNWMPRNLGSMMLRPGTAYIGNTASNNKARYIPFIYATDDLALIEITDSLMRVWVDDALVTRSSVSTSITNGSFATDLTGWTDNDESGGVSSRVMWDSIPYLVLKVSNSPDAAIRTQEVTVAAGDQNVEHALNIQIGTTDQSSLDYSASSALTLRVGSTDGDDDYIAETRLDEGYHSLTFTPTGNFWIQLSTRCHGPVHVASVAIDGAGTMEITSPYAEADLGKLRYDSSGDVIYIACDGYPQYKIERRSSTGWSMARYNVPDGPYGLINTTTTTLDPTGLVGLVTIAASAPLFKQSDVGRLVKLVTNGQYAAGNFTTEDTWTDAIKVTGITTARVFTRTISGRVDSTITLQRSTTSATTGFDEVATYTANDTISYDDTLDNQIAWYRIGIATGDYGTDTVSVSLSYPLGTTDGVLRIYRYTSSTAVSCQVLSPLANTDATVNWYLGSWSDRLGYPTAVAFDGGRLGWFGKGKSWLSASDAYDSFDPETIGDSAPITRTITSGPIDKANWALSLRRLLFGTGGGEHVIRGSTEDDPLTQSNAMLRSYGTQGSANVLGLKLDNTGLFVQRGGIRLMETVFGTEWEYETTDLTTFNPSIGSPGITHIALQRQPDNRVHCVRSDGTVAVLLHDTAENVTCWVEVEAAGPGTKQYEYEISNPFSVNGEPRKAVFNDTGLQLFYIDSNNYRIYTLSLSVAYDIDTAEDLADIYDLSNDFGVVQIYDAAYGNSGNNLYVLDGTNNLLVEYEMSSPYALGTLSLTGKSLDFSSEVAGANSYAFSVKPNGTRVWVLTSGRKVFQYDLNTAHDFDTKAYGGVNWDLSGDITAVGTGSLVVDERDVYVNDNIGNALKKYQLGTAWDVGSNPVDTGWTLDYSSEDTSAIGMAFSPDYDKLYLIGLTGTDTIYQYSESSAPAEVEDVVILPGADGTGEDAVYYSVKQVINGSTVRFLEKWSLESECQGGTQNKNLDSHVAGTVTGGIMAGLSHLEGEEVAVWVNGVDAGTYLVISGQITGVTSDGSAVAGLSYKGQFKSSKLGNLLDKKNVTRLGVILDKTHYQGLKYGPNFDELDDLPLLEDESIQDADAQHDQYDEESFSFNGSWDTDSRVCLQAESPRNVTLLAAVIETED